jgi:dTDP-4-dehydrorhamnose 3,5-epimerase
VKIESTLFEDVLIFKNQSYKDSRGSFEESFRLDKINQAINREICFCQDNLARSKKGVIRGLHYQMLEHSQSKLVSVIKGKVLDVIVDIRKGSPTFGKHISIELCDTKKKCVFIPRGFAHGYITLSENSIFHYKVDNYYNAHSEAGIAYNDPNLGINWRLSKSELLVSEKDKNHPLLKDAILFDFNTNLYE